MFIELGFFALGITVLLNLCGTIWWAGNMNSRVKTMEERIAQVTSLPERLARIETVVQTLVQTSQNTANSVESMKTFILTSHDQRLKQLAGDE